MKNNNKEQIINPLHQKTFSHWPCKRETPTFGPWSGKREVKNYLTKKRFGPWYGKREAAPTTFGAWSGKRASKNVKDWSTIVKQKNFGPWKGKREDISFGPWSRKKEFHPVLVEIDNTRTEEPSLFVQNFPTMFQSYPKR